MSAVAAAVAAGAALPAAGQSERQASGVIITGLHKSFGDHPVLRGLDLEIPTDSITAILGPSGSGKTTLLRTLAGFQRPDAGSIVVGGTTIDGPGCHIKAEARRIGYVPQEGSLFPHLDVRANIGFGLRRGQRQARVDALLEMTDLIALAHRYPHQLSGGQQQRVALARALAPEPALMLLDEPFSSLDASLRATVRLEVVTILRRAGTTSVIVTHDQNEAFSIADQVAVLRDGLVAQAGPPEEVYTHPADPDLACFLGEGNLLDGAIRAGRADTGLGSLPLLDGLAHLDDGAAVRVLIRPEQISLVPVGTGGSISGVVVQRDYHGHDTLVAVETDPSAACGTICVRFVGPTALSPGTTVALRTTAAVMAWTAPMAEPRR